MNGRAIEVSSALDPTPFSCALAGERSSVFFCRPRPWYCRYVQVNAGVPYWEAIVMVSVAARIAVLPAVATFVSEER